METPSGDEPQVNPDPGPTPEPQPNDEDELQPGVSGSVLDLDAFTADNYDTTTNTMTTESGWTGGQLWIGDDSQFGGSRLVIMTAEDKGRSHGHVLAFAVQRYIETTCVSQ